MNKNVTEIVHDVRHAIDEIEANDSEFLSGQDEVDLDAIIESKICEAVDWVHSSAALEVMAGDVFDQKTVVAAGLDVTDMLRFIQGKVNGWRGAVRELTEEGTIEYVEAVDEYVGASVDRPAVVLEYVNGGRVLNMLPSLGEGESGEVIVIDRCEIDSTGGETPEEYVRVDSGVYAAMVEYLGGLVLMVLNDERGENMVQLAKGMIGMEAGGGSDAK